MGELLAHFDKNIRILRFFFEKNPSFSHDFYQCAHIGLV